MLNLNKIGRPVARIDKGKYNGMIVSVTDQFQNNDKEENGDIIKEFKRLQISNDSKFQQVANTTKERTKKCILPGAVVVVNLLIPGNLLKR